MPGYMDIADEYRQTIRSAQLKPGSPMPSYAEAAERHQVNRTTVVRAYEVLKREGLIVARAGVGTIVASRPRVVITGAQRVARIDAGGPDLAHGETVTDRYAGLLSLTDPAIATELGVELHDEVVVRRRTFRVNSVPHSYAITVIHMRALAEIPSLLSNGPVGDWRAAYEQRTGKAVHSSPERRGARHASRDELGALEVTVPSGDIAVPVLITQSTFHDEDGPLFVMEDVYRPGTWQHS